MYLGCLAAFRATMDRAGGAKPDGSSPAALLHLKPMVACKLKGRMELIRSRPGRSFSSGRAGGRAAVVIFIAHQLRD